MLPVKENDCLFLHFEEKQIFVPDDIIDRIVFEIFDDIIHAKEFQNQNLKSLRLINKTIHRSYNKHLPYLINMFFSPTYLPGVATIEQMHEYFKKYGNDIKMLNLNNEGYIDDFKLNRLFGCLPKIQEIKLSECFLSSSIKCSSLEKVTLSKLNNYYSEYYYPSPFFPLLSTLKIKNCLLKRLYFPKNFELNSVTISNCKKLDISCLKKVRGLESLNLKGQYRNYEKINSLTDLKSLKIISTNNFYETNLISNLTNLKTLVIEGEDCGYDLDMQPLLNLNHLQSLTIGKKEFDFSLIQNFSNLNSLCIYNCSLHDISFAANLTQLTDLNLNDTDIEDFNPILSLVNLKSLDVTYTTCKLEHVLKFFNTLSLLEIVKWGFDETLNRKNLPSQENYAVRLRVRRPNPYSEEEQPDAKFPRLKL